MSGNDVREIQPGDVVSKIEDGMVGVVVDVRPSSYLVVDVHWANGLTEVDARGFDRVMLPSGKSPASFAELLRDKSTLNQPHPCWQEFYERCKRDAGIDAAMKERLDRAPERITIDTSDADAVRKYRDQIGRPVAGAHARIDDLEKRLRVVEGFVRNRSVPPNDSNRLKSINQVRGDAAEAGGDT